MSFDGGCDYSIVSTVNLYNLSPSDSRFTFLSLSILSHSTLEREKNTSRFVDSI